MSTVSRSFGSSLMSQKKQKKKHHERKRSDRSQRDLETYTHDGANKSHGGAGHGHSFSALCQRG